MRILGQDDEVGQLAARDRSLDRFLARRVGAIQGIDAQRLVHGDALIGAPDFAIPTRARHHALDPHQGRKGTGIEIRARGCRHAGIEKRAVRHAALHQFLAVEVKLIRVVVSVRSKERGHDTNCLDAAYEVVRDECAMRDLGTRIGSGFQAQRALICGKDMIDCDVAIGVAIHLNAGAVHALAPFIQVLLRFSHVAFVAVAAGIGDADGHGAFGERAVRGVFAGRAQPDPLIAQAGRHAAAQHGLELRPFCLVAHTMQQRAPSAHLLQRLQIA